MSGRLVSAVYESTLPAWLKPYAAACATFAKDDGSRVYPSIARLAAMVGRTERATQTAMKELRRRRILVVVQASGRYRSTTYRLDPAALPSPLDPGQLVLFPQAIRAKSHANTTIASSFPQFPQESTVMGEAHFTPWVKPTSPDPLGDPSKTTQRTTRARAENFRARKVRTA